MTANLQPELAIDSTAVSGCERCLVLHLVLTYHWYDETESGRKSNRIPQYDRPMEEADMGNVATKSRTFDLPEDTLPPCRLSRLRKSTLDHARLRDGMPNTTESISSRTIEFCRPKGWQQRRVRNFIMNLERLYDHTDKMLNDDELSVQEETLDAV